MMLELEIDRTLGSRKYYLLYLVRPGDFVDFSNILLGWFRLRAPDNCENGLLGGQSDPRTLDQSRRGAHATPRCEPP